MLDSFAATGIRKRVFRAAIKFGDLLGRQIVTNISKFFQNLAGDFAPFLFRQAADLFQNFSCAHVFNLPRRPGVASLGQPPFSDVCDSPAIDPMIPREILKKIRLIELRTTRLVSETLGGQYHSVFKGQGMNFEEVREYQPGDEVRSIDWNVTARMNHPFVKKFVEERELTLMLVVDLSGSGLFGSGAQSKRELAAEIASVLAFSAIRNNDKVGLILFTEEVEKFIPPKKGRRHVLRVIREILCFQPRQRGTNFKAALDALNRLARRHAIAVIISDFLFEHGAGASQDPGHPSAFLVSPTLGPRTLPALRQANRRHDVIAIQIVDRYELELPALGRLELSDAETGECIEINTHDSRKRRAFADRRAKHQADLFRQLRSANIDTIEARAGEPYAAALGQFFQTREKRRRHGRA